MSPHLNPRSAVLLAVLLATFGGTKVAAALVRDVPNYASPEIRANFPALF